MNIESEFHINLYVKDFKIVSFFIYSFVDIVKDLEDKLNTEKIERNDERNLMARHISEKTKLLEVANKKIENTNGDLEAAKNKHSQTIKVRDYSCYAYPKFG